MLRDACRMCEALAHVIKCPEFGISVCFFVCVVFFFLNNSNKKNLYHVGALFNQWKFIRRLSTSSRFFNCINWNFSWKIYKLPSKTCRTNYVARRQIAIVSFGNTENSLNTSIDFYNLHKISTLSPFRWKRFKIQ